MVVVQVNVERRQDLDHLLLHVAPAATVTTIATSTTTASATASAAATPATSAIGMEVIHDGLHLALECDIYVLRAVLRSVLLLLVLLAAEQRLHHLVVLQSGAVEVRHRREHDALGQVHLRDRERAVLPPHSLDLADQREGHDDGRVGIGPSQGNDFGANALLCDHGRVGQVGVGGVGQLHGRDALLQTYQSENRPLRILQQTKVKHVSAAAHSALRDHSRSQRV